MKKTIGLEDVASGRALIHQAVRAVLFRETKADDFTRALSTEGYEPRTTEDSYATHQGEEDR